MVVVQTHTYFYIEAINRYFVVHRSADILLGKMKSYVRALFYIVSFTCTLHVQELHSW